MPRVLGSRLCLPSPPPCRPLLSLLLQPVFAPMLQSNPRMLKSGSHPQAIVSSSTPQYPSAEQPTPQALYGEFCTLPPPGCAPRSPPVCSALILFPFPAVATVHQSYPHHATQLHAHQPQPATTPTGSQPQSQHAAPSPVQVPAMGDPSGWGRNGWLQERDRLGVILQPGGRTQGSASGKPGDQRRKWHSPSISP